MIGDDKRNEEEEGCEAFYERIGFVIVQQSKCPPKHFLSLLYFLVILLRRIKDGKRYHRLFKKANKANIRDNSN